MLTRKRRVMERKNLIGMKLVIRHLSILIPNCLFIFSHQKTLVLQKKARELKMIYNTDHNYEVENHTTATVISHIVRFSH